MESIYNFSKDVKQDDREFKKELNYSKYLPHQFFRWLITAPTGFGKTNLLLHTLIGDEETFKFDRVWLCVRDPTEDLYEHLIEKLNMIATQAVSEMAKLGHRIPKPEVVKIFDKIDDIPKLTPELKKERLSIMLIVDDYNGDKKMDAFLNAYIKRCRKWGVNLIYLAQNFYEVPSTLRQNFDYISLFEIPDERSKRELAQTYSLGITKEEFGAKYKLATSRPYMPLTIDLTPATKIHNPDFMWRSGFKPLTEMDAKINKTKE